MAALALPPSFWLPLLVPAFAGLAALMDRAPSRPAAFGAGWAFGLGYFSVGLNWLTNSFMVDPDRFGALAVPAVMGLSAGLALFTGLATLVAWSVAPARPVMRTLCLAASWTGAEWLRGNLFTGFPWNLAAHAWAVTDETMQAVSLAGAYGLSFATVFLAALPRLASRRRHWPAWVSVIAAAALWIGGYAWLGLADDAAGTGVMLRVVQGNVPQQLKWREDQQDRILARYLTLSRSGGQGRPDVVIWPETAVPFLLAEDAVARQEVSHALPPGGVLLAGTVLRGAAPAPGPYNGLIAINADAEVIASYRKVHLVPFGEYMPLRRFLPFEKLTVGSADFRPGSEPEPLMVAGLPPFGPMICYEAIFPGHAVRGETRPAWLLNITNDAWFGASWGPYQHLQIARLRAVESGIPLVRAANTGISAVVDAHGRVREQLPLGETGVIDAQLPAPLANPPLYARTGDAPALGLVALVLGWAACRRISAPRLGRPLPEAG